MKHVQPKPKKATGDCWKEVIAIVDRMAKSESNRVFGRKTSKGTYALVLKDMRSRRRFGIKKYGVPVQPNNGRDHLLDCYQELLDAAVYAIAAEHSVWDGDVGPRLIMPIINLILQLREELPIKI